MLLNSSKKILSKIIIASAYAVPQYVNAFNDPILTADAVFQESLANRIKPGDVGIVFQSNPATTIWNGNNTFTATALLLAKILNHKDYSTRAQLINGYMYFDYMNFINSAAVPASGSVSSIFYLATLSNIAPATPYAFVDVPGSGGVDGYFIVTQSQAIASAMSAIQNKPISYTTTGYVFDGTSTYPVTNIASSVKFN